MDTTRHYEFPGTSVWRCSMNLDSFPDFVCWSYVDRTITVLFGTKNPVAFDTALVLRGDVNRDEFGQVSMVVGKCDSDQFDDIVLVDGLFSDSLGNTLGRLMYFKGGPILHPAPTDLVVGQLGKIVINGTLKAGNLHGGSDRFLAHLPGRTPQPIGGIALYPLGLPEFRFRSSDTVLLDMQGASGTGGFLIVDADGDGTDDVLLGTDSVVLIYHGAKKISSVPTFALHKPFATYSNSWGSLLVDIGDATGRGYPTLLVTDFDASLGNQENGAIFLFNMGKGLKDNCTGYARGNEFEGMFGYSAIALGDVSGDGRADFMVGGDQESNVAIHVGYVAVFLGDSSYGPKTGVRELGIIPERVSLQQNYPNPFSHWTMIQFDLASNHNEETRLDILDMLGRTVAELYHGRGNESPHVVPFDGSMLPTGTYALRLASGTRIESKLMQITR